MVDQSHLLRLLTLTDIPTVGPSGFFTTFLAIKRYLKSPEEFLEEGYRKFPNVAFKLYTMDGWIVVASGTDRLADLRKAGDDVLSFEHSMEDLIQIKFTLGKELQWDMHNTDYIKLVAATSLTRSIADKFDEIREEIGEAIESNFPSSNEWIPVIAIPAIVRIVSRAANRMLLGPTFAKDPEFLQVTTDFTANVVKGCTILHIFPEICRPLVAKNFCQTESYYKKALKFLEPMLRYRLDQEMKFGQDWKGKPVFLQLVLQTFTRLLRPWDKRCLILLPTPKELLVTSGRRVLKQFTFSNGQTIPPGFEIVVPSKAIHLDDSNYASPREFRPFRFGNMNLDSVEEDIEGDLRPFVTPSKTFMLFGAPGRHNCPGRFFAATEIKLVMAYLVMNYDIKFEHGERPENHVLGPALSVNETAQVLFRKSTELS
ncbi:cytochrome P450 [Flagelloscypha sp. PMI_526]|nr:cytochrome P450 [Flagelloscypha sp. PMI_526]